MDHLNQLLNSILAHSPGVVGALLCGNDGRSVAHVGTLPTIDATSAVTASSVQLGRRLAELLGPAGLDELTVHSGDGYVIMYIVGEHSVLTVMTSANANVALTNLVVRKIVPDLAKSVEGGASLFPAPTPLMSSA